MKISKRVGAFVLVVAMLIPSGIVTASADLIENENLVEATIYIVDRIGGVQFPTGEVRMDTLEGIRDRYNATLKQLQLFPEGAFGLIYADLGYAVITEEAGSGIARLIDSKNNFFITDGWGNYPYCYVAGDVPAEDIAVENVHANIWLGLTERSKEVETVTQDALATAVIALNDAGTECSLVKGYYNEILYYFICTPDYKYYCNSKGEMFVAPAEASATDLNRPHYNDDGDTMETPVIDRDNQTLNLPMADGTVVNLTIDNMTYDDGDKSYTVNAYTTINEGDNYYYTYYTYNVQYNITNTYITYIGSNEPYEREEYELYYELPDGRSSADLTAEEVAGMSFEFYDVVNYKRSTDDVSVRGLYHFDGNTEDDSYFTGQGSFTWNEGASLTYMEAGEAFGGALYLDNTAHSFDIALPRDLSVSDFTIQFRYYQASEPDTLSNIENYVVVGSMGQALAWDEANLYRNASSSALNSLPVGTWNELAIVRDDGIVYQYLNGLCIGSYPYYSAVSGGISFNFGSTSRAYTMIDEMRILSVAIVEDGAQYSPTTVPHDSNLVLVLPDADDPIADEYLLVTSSGTNLLGDVYDFTNGGRLENITGNTVASDYLVNNIGGGLNDMRYLSDYYTVSVGEDAVYLSRTGTHYSASYETTWGFCFRIGPPDAGIGIKANTDYTFSIVHTDGSVDSLTFNTGSDYFPASSTNRWSNRSCEVVSSKDFGWGQLTFSGLCVLHSGSYYYIAPVVTINPYLGSTVDVAYIELVEGSSTDLKGEVQRAVYEGVNLHPNTAAIQTTIPVNGYTVGGIRPSMPAKGDLWFPVMENRITSVQIYAGTHWEEVNARWWTGSRWIPIYAFDINTLEDLFDIADGDSTVPLLPDQNSFLRWWQLQWLDFRQWLEKTLGSGGGGSGSDCQHVYSPEITRDPGCVEPGITTFTCSECGHQYTQIIDAHGHDWVTTDTVPDVLDEDDTVIEEGYDILTCSICDATARDYGDGPEEDDLFDALGDLLAGGVEWLLDKLTQLADKLRLITQTFTGYIDKIKGFGGEFPAFFAAAFALIPEELRLLFWTAVVGFVVLVVWKKYSS